VAFDGGFMYGTGSMPGPRCLWVCPGCLERCNDVVVEAVRLWVSKGTSGFCYCMTRVSNRLLFRSILVLFCLFGVYSRISGCKGCQGDRVGMCPGSSLLGRNLYWLRWWRQYSYGLSRPLSLITHAQAECWGVV
jgi:hypothetical protein